MLDGYAILGKLGDRGLLLARRPGEGGELYAIRRTPSRLAGLPQLREALEQARRAMALRHPNIARLVEIGEDDGTPFLASEYVPGVDLRTLMRAGHARLSPPLVALIGARVAAALEHAHDGAVDESGRPLHIVHGGVTPQSIRMDPEGRVKVLDFAVAHARSLSLEDLAYVSPEQVKDLPTDGRSDLFSLGVVLHELVCGRPLFHREDDEAICDAVLTWPIPRPSEIAGPGVPEALDRAVMRALERDPDARYATAGELRLELEAAAHGASEAALGALVREALPGADSSAAAPPEAPASSQPLQLKGPHAGADTGQRADPDAPDASVAAGTSEPARPGPSLVAGTSESAQPGPSDASLPLGVPGRAEPSHETPSKSLARVLRERAASRAAREATAADLEGPPEQAEPREERSGLRWGGWLVLGLVALVIVAAVMLSVQLLRPAAVPGTPDTGVDLRRAPRDLRSAADVVLQVGPPIRPKRFRPKKPEKRCCTVSIITDPEGVLVHQAGSPIGRTPLSIYLQKGETAELLLAKEGWAERRLTVKGRAHETLRVVLPRRR